MKSVILSFITFFLFQYNLAILIKGREGFIGLVCQNSVIRMRKRKTKERELKKSEIIITFLFIKNKFFTIESATLTILLPITANIISI